jgi:hypothetical protein
MTDDLKDVEIIDAKPMQLEHKVSDITDQTEQGLALLEERVRVAKRQLAIALRLAQPGQIMAYGEGDKQSIYLTGGAADRILRIGFGFRWANKKVSIDRDEEGITAIASGDLLRHNGEMYESFTGIRRMLYNPERKGGIEGYIKNEPDLIKAALQNMKHTAVHDLLGLRFLSRQDISELGVDLDSLERKVEFQDHGEDVADTPRVPFGKNKGKPITELSARSLDWYIDAARKNISDPEKQRWRAKEEKWIAGLTAEKARREGRAPEPMADEYANVGPPPMEREPGEDG